METLKKSEVVSLVAGKTNQSKKDTEETIDALIEIITENIRQGKKINFTGFGAFWVKERKARLGFNPRTKEKIQIPATKFPKFKAGQNLKDSVK